jgi:hypothetical protein
MFDATFIANPYPTYQYLLANGRVHWVDYMGGAWLVPHYADVQALLRDPRLSAERADMFAAPFPPAQRDSLQEMINTFHLSLVFTDGERHLRQRRLLNKAFTPRVVENLRPAIQQLADQLIDAMLVEAKESGRIELMHQFAHPLPALVIAQLLGVSSADRPLFVRWSNDLAAFMGSANPTFEMALVAQDSMAALINYFRGIVDERRAQPQDDFITQLISAEEQGDGLSEAELLVQAVLLLTAGHETTRNLIGNGMQALLQHPDQLALLQRDPSLMRGALDEMLRYDSPLQAIPRIATENFELHGATIQRGQIVLLLPGAAHWDPAQFAQPERFDITRQGTRPLAFGHGAHVCLGMPLAYLEGEIAVRTLLRRLPKLQLVNTTPDWSPNFQLRGLRSLPLSFGPSEAIAAPTTEDEPLLERALGAGCPYHSKQR